MRAPVCRGVRVLRDRNRAGNVPERRVAGKHLAQHCHRSRSEIPGLCEGGGNRCQRAEPQHGVVAALPLLAEKCRSHSCGCRPATSIRRRTRQSKRAAVALHVQRERFAGGARPRTASERSSQSCDGLSIDGDDAIARLQPGDRGAAAGLDRADDRRDRPLRGAEADAFDLRLVAEARRQLFEMQHARAHLAVRFAHGRAASACAPASASESARPRSVQLAIGSPSTLRCDRRAACASAASPETCPTSGR